MERLQQLSSEIESDSPAQQPTSDFEAMPVTPVAPARAATHFSPEGGAGDDAEVEFWRRRIAELSAVPSSHAPVAADSTSADTPGGHEGASLLSSPSDSSHHSLAGARPAPDGRRVKPRRPRKQEEREPSPKRCFCCPLLQPVPPTWFEKG